MVAVLSSLPALVFRLNSVGCAELHPIGTIIIHVAYNIIEIEQRYLWKLYLNLDLLRNATGTLFTKIDVYSDGYAKFDSEYDSIEIITNV